MKKHSDKLVVFALRHHGPLSDAQLAWMLGLVGVKAGTATAKRRRLTKREIVRRHEETQINARGQAVNQWELHPKWRFRNPF